MQTQFRYKAVNAKGTVIEGFVSAESSKQTLELLSEQNLIPVSIKPVKNNRKTSLFGFFKSSDYENLITFTNNFATLYRAGIPLIKSLSLIKIGKADSKFNEALLEIKNQVQSGTSLSNAMAEQEEIFSKVYISSIAAGEESGKLDEILEKLSPILEKELELTRQIKSGIRYPLMVITAIVLAMVVMMTMVVPKFISFYSTFDADLPLPTRIITATSSFLLNYWPFLIGVIVLLVIGYLKLVKNEKGRYWVDYRFLKIPIIGQLIIKGNVARFSLLFSILFKAGIPIVQALDLLEDSVKNTVIGAEIRKMKLFFQEGRESNLTKEEFVFFPEMALQMIYIGLESGSLEKILDETGNHYSKEVQYMSKQLTSVLEPILTLVIGIFVLILALAIFLPMWNLIQVFKS